MVGRIRDLYFEEKTWKVQYLALNTGSWPITRCACVPPKALQALDWGKRQGSLRLSGEQVANSPVIEPGPLLFWHNFAKLDEYFGLCAWPTIDARSKNRNSRSCRERRVIGSPPLRSARELPAYRVEVGGAEIGRVEDVLFDDETWKVCYLLVDCWSWSPGRTELFPPECIKSVSRSEFRVSAEYRHEIARNRA
jgi:hypothetical protein